MNQGKSRGKRGKNDHNTVLAMRYNIAFTCNEMIKTGVKSRRREIHIMTSQAGEISNFAKI